MTKIELEDVLFELHDKGLRNLKFNMKRVVKRVDAYANERVMKELGEVLEQDKLPTAYINQKIKELKQK